MTREEMLVKIEVYIAEFCEDSNDCEICAPWKALRAIIELHKPMATFPPGSNNSKPICLQCRENEFPADYPCQTIQTIEKELSQ